MTADIRKETPPVRCGSCGYRRVENGVLRCPYMTIDLDADGYCSKGKNDDQAGPYSERV